MAQAGASAVYEQQGTTLLAMQPPTVNADRAPKIDPDWSTIYEHLENRLTSLRSWRYSWWAFWSVLAAFFLPFRYVWLVTANRMWRGSNLNNQIINSHGLLAVRTCSAGLWTGLCSPSRPWFKLGSALPWAKPDTDGKIWLKDTEDKLYTVLAQSNFYDTMSQAFRDETVFGTAPVIVYEDAEDIARFYLPAAGEYYLGNGPRLTTDTHYREFTYTVLQIVGMFGLDACPAQVQQLWVAGSYDKELVVAHAIEPNFDLKKKGDIRGRVKVVPSNFQYREVYWLRGNKSEKPLSVKGFTTRPFMALRWATVSNDAYGRSPCMDAIGDNKQIQLEDMRKAEFIEKGVRPPMGAAPEMKNEPSSILPGMITYTSTDSGKKGFWPLFEVNFGWLQALTADITKVEERIDHCLYVDLFMAISKMEGVQPRNELELTKRDLERLQELGPVISLAEKEFDIMLQRLMEILERRKLLKPRPPSLQNVPIKIDYVSILRLAQRSAESVAMKDVFQTGGGLSSAAKAGGLPDPLRIINLDESYRRYADINNFPEDCLYSDDEVAAHDKARDAAKQQAQMPAQAMAGVQAAKTLSETQLPGGNNGLAALLGGGQGG